GRSAGASDEQSLLVRETARSQERIAVGDAYPLVDELRIHRRRPRVLADSFDEVRLKIARPLRRVDRAFRIGADDEHLRLSFLEVTADAGDGSAGSDGDHDRVDLAAGLLPALG